MPAYYCYRVIGMASRGDRATIEAATSLAARQEYIRRYADLTDDITDVCAVSVANADDKTRSIVLNISKAPMPRNFIAELRKA